MKFQQVDFDIEQYGRFLAWCAKRKTETVEEKRRRYDSLQHGQKVEFGELFLGDIVWYPPCEKTFEVIEASDEIGNGVNIRSLPDGYVTGPGIRVHAIFLAHSRTFDQLFPNGGD